MTSSSLAESSACVHATLRLALPSHAVSKTIQQIHEACDAAEDIGQYDALLIHIQGSDRVLTGENMDMPLHSQWERALRRIEMLRVPTVCVVDGACVGLMFEVLLCTDYRIAGTQLLLGLAHVADSLWPSMAIHRLATQLGVAQARTLVLFDTTVEGDQAIQLGLIQRIAADPTAASSQFLANLRASGIQDVSVRRQLLLEAQNSSHESALGAHMAACDRALRREGRRAAALGVRDDN
jgi:isomerase DpgB